MSINDSEKNICIPTQGDSELPTKIFNHPYCVDIIEAYKGISKLDFKEKEEYLGRMEFLIRNYCNTNNINFKFYFENKFPIIIPSNVKHFDWYLATYLINFDPYKIKRLLNFQQSLFKNKRISFIDFIENKVYDILNGFSGVDRPLQKKMIMEWVNKQRSKSKSNKSNNSKKDYTIFPSFKLIGFKNNPNYIIENTSQILDAYMMLKSKFIFEKTKYEHLISILKGEEIKKDNKIKWKGTLIELKMFIQLLFTENKVVKFDFKWDTASLCFVKYDDKSKKIKELTPPQISKSNGKTTNQDELKKIVQLL